MGTNTHTYELREKRNWFSCQTAVDNSNSINRRCVVSLSKHSDMWCDCMVGVVEGVCESSGLLYTIMKRKREKQSM